MTLHMKRYHLAQNYIIQYGVEKSTYKYFVENQFFAQSNYSIYKLPFDTKLVMLLFVVPEIEGTRSSDILVHGACNMAQLRR